MVREAGPDAFVRGAPGTRASRRLRSPGRYRAAVSTTDAVSPSASRRTGDSTPPGSDSATRVRTRARSRASVSTQWRPRDRWVCRHQLHLVHALPNRPRQRGKARARTDPVSVSRRLRTRARADLAHERFGHRRDARGCERSTRSLDSSQRRERSAGWIGAHIGTNCRLHGDFDVQVDYELLVWPDANGVGAFMNTYYGPAPNFESITRQSLPWASSTTPVDGPVVVRLDERSGRVSPLDAREECSPHRRATGGGLACRRDQTSGDRTGRVIPVGAATGDEIFGDRDVKVAFDNFSVNSSGSLQARRRTPRTPGGAGGPERAEAQPHTPWIYEAAASSTGRRSDGPRNRPQTSEDGEGEDDEARSRSAATRNRPRR